MTSVSGHKVWVDGDDQDGIRPDSIRIHLLLNGERMLTRTVEAGTDGSWSYSFRNLPTTVDGNPAVYSIEEDPVTGYTGQVDGYDVINTHVPDTRTIEGRKTWDDEDDQDGLRPLSIEVHLYGSGQLLESRTVTAEDDWSWRFANLPRYAGGKEIIYQITETPVPDYSTEVHGYDLTNSYTPGKTSLPVTKLWEDNDDQDGLRPESVTVSLLADGLPTGQTLTLTAEEGWTGILTDLDEMADGHVIGYSIEETNVPGYISEVTGNNTGYILTNRHEPELLTVDGRKEWNVAAEYAEMIPGSIRIRLLADGKEKDTRTVTEQEYWEWHFTGLPKYKDGREIDYTITEDPLSGFEQTVDGYNVTNTYVPGKASLTVTKYTESLSGERFHVRNETFYVSLFRDAALTERIGEVRTLAFRDSGAETVTFEDLDPFTLYYAAETDADGTPAPIGLSSEGSPVLPAYPGGEEYLRMQTGTTGSTTAGEFSNQFVRPPSDFYYEGELTVVKILQDASGRPITDSNETFYAGVFTNEACTTLADSSLVTTNPLVLSLNGDSRVQAKTPVILSGEDPSVTLYVTEVTSDGTPVENAESFAYAWSVDNGVVTFTKDDTFAMTTIINEPEEGDPDDPTPTPTVKVTPTDKPRGGGGPDPDNPVREHSTVTKNAARTGDDTPIGTALIWLLAAIWIIVPVWMMRRRRNQ